MPRKSKQSGERSYTIKGDVKAGRDIIMGDQTINTQYLSSVQTPSEFVEALQKLQEEIANLKKDPALAPPEVRRIEVVEADVQDAIEEAKKPEPLADRINKTLDGAKETMEKLSGSVGTAMALGAGLAQLAQVAIKLFGA